MTTRLPVSMARTDALLAEMKEAFSALEAEFGCTIRCYEFKHYNYWCVKTAVFPADMARDYDGKREPTSFLRTACALDRDTGTFVKGHAFTCTTRPSHRTNGFRPSMRQPKNPPTIDNYSLDAAGTVNGVGYHVQPLAKFVALRAKARP